MSFRFSVAALVAGTLLLFGCNQKPAEDKDKPGGAPTATASENIRQLRELKITDKVVGKGTPVKAGDLVSMVYTGTFKNGVEFDSNDKEGGTPYSFVLGAGNVIPGWDKGLVGMKVGGVRLLEVPNALAYGDSPQGDKVPAGADLYFEVKLVDAVRVGEEGVFDKEDVKIGTGKAVKMGDTVEVNYVMSLVNDKVVDNQMDKTQPVTFRVGPKLKDGDRIVPSGIYAAMIGMKEGGVRKMRIPPAIGFAISANSAIPPNSVVKIEMHLRKVK